MDWEQLGYLVGNAGTMAWAQNYFNRGVDKAREKLAGVSDTTEEDRKKAMAAANARLGGGGLIGRNPKTMLLQQKRDWMQADNDARYLLNNGYAEDSPEVQEFRRKQAGAHANAEKLRGFGKSMGLDLSKTGAGLSLSELKDAVNRSIAPMMYQKYPDMQEQMAARNAWAGQTAREIMGAQAVQPFVPHATATQGGGGVPAASPQPVGGVAPMTPPAAQLGGYVPQQGASLIGFDPNAGFGMAGTANPVGGAANPTVPDGGSNGRTITSGDVYKYLQDIGYLPKEKTYEEEIEEIAKEYARARAAKMDDREIRKYLKDNGVPSNIAKIVMAERAQQNQEMAKKNALAQAAVASSSPQMEALIMAAASDPNMKLSDITGLINATNPDLRLDTIDLGGTKVAMTRDTKGRVTGGAQVLPVTLSPKDAADTQYRYAKLGADVDIANQTNHWRYYNTNTTADTSRQNSMRQAQTALDVANINGQYGLEKSKIVGERASFDGGRGVRQEGGLKPNEALNILKQAQLWDEDHPGEEWANPLADARDRALVALNDYGNVDPENEQSVYSFGTAVLEQNARDGFPYTAEQLKQIIRSIGGKWADQAAENLLSGQSAEYGR